MTTHPKPFILPDLPDPTGHQMTGLGLISSPPPISPPLQPTEGVPPERPPKE